MTSADVKNPVNLFRIQMLIIDGGLLVMRHILDQKLQVKSISFDDCLTQEKTAITRLKWQKGITQVQYDHLYPSSSQLHSTADLDITLLICLLQNLKICGLNSKFKWNVQPHAGDTSIEADIYRLNQFRIEMAHISTPRGIDPAKFNSKWTHIEQILLRLNDSTSNPLQNLQTIINDIKARSLDPDAEGRVDKVNNDWQLFEKGLEVEMHTVKLDTSELYEQTNIQKKSVTEFENQTTPNIKSDPAHDVDTMRELIEDPEIKAAKKVIDNGWGKLLDYMIPDPILDYATDLFTFRECRDIKEEKNTTERNRSILGIIRRKGKNGYIRFKDCLLKTDQSLLAEFLTKIERDEDTKDVLKLLHDKITKVQQKEFKETKESAAKKSELQQIQDDYQQKKKHLKEDLITLYRQQYHTLPLSPLFEEHDTPLLNFYVMPDINAVESERPFGGGSKIKSKVTSLHDVFYKNTKLCREIYLEAGAGLGKTAFSKRLALTWCQAHNYKKDEAKYFEKDEMTAMSEFEFVFLLSLRDCSEECDTDQMIRKQIFPLLAHTYDKIEDVLSEGKCLVVLDGLDEWSHPKTPCPFGKSSDIPHRRARHCITLSTSRPWKLSVINLKSSQIDKRLELDGLSKKSRYQLKRSVITLFNHKRELIDDQIKKFDFTIAAKGISDLESVPLLLMYLLCLWCYEINLESSKCKIYCQIVELLLKRTLKTKQAMKYTCARSTSNIPSCFHAQKNCKENYSFLSSLGQLAFETLFCKTKENSLVFDSSLVDKHLELASVELSLRSGIITQDKERKMTDEQQKTSFAHKTVQEFFAALYISTRSNQVKIRKTILSFCNSVEDILEISEVFVFMSGINADLFSSVSGDIMKVINDDEITRTYRSVTYPTDYDKYIAPLKEIQGMLISCIKEIPENSDFKLCLEDYIFDKACQQEKYYTHLQRLAKQNKNNIKSIRLRMQGIRSLSEVITDCELSDRAINYQKIYYCGECKGAELIPLLSRSVKCVTIASCKWRKIHITPKVSSWSPELSKIVQNNNQLQAINIFCFKFNHDVLQEFLNYLVNRKAMNEIKLYRLFCIDHGASCPGFNFDLSQHTELKRLALGIIPLAQLNVNVSLLEECLVGEFSNPGVLKSCLNNISAASKLQTFICSDLKSSDDIQTMLQTFSLLVTVKHVKLFYMNLGECLLPHKIVDIEYVELLDVGMSSLTLIDLVNWIKNLPQQVTIEMVDCEITPRREFERFKKDIQSKFVVIFDGKMVDGRHAFKFTKIK